MIEQDRDLTNFAEALQSSDLGSRLSGSDFFTVFAPSDEFIRDDNDDVDFVMPPETDRSGHRGDQAGDPGGRGPGGHQGGGQAYSGRE